LCITKLDVLDKLDSLKLCVAYKINGREYESPPFSADLLETCDPVYIEMPGWQESTLGVTRLDDLPQNARAFLRQIESLVERPIVMVSTGPERNQNIILRNPYE
jgi:adenylosuccinate synthase